MQLVRVDGLHDLTVGVWERGAGETLSSGTSSVSAAAAAIANGWCETRSPSICPAVSCSWSCGRRKRAVDGPAEEICRVELV